jgi:hypothetical protein
VFDLASYKPNLFEYQRLNIVGSINTVLLENLKTFGIILYSTKNLRHQNLVLNVSDNRRLTESYQKLTILYSKITGTNITLGQTSGSAAVKKKTKSSVGNVRTTKHQQNAASGSSYLSPDGGTL